jgi:phosphonate transport system ATP-binding protein
MRESIPEGARQEPVMVYRHDIAVAVGRIPEFIREAQAALEKFDLAGKLWERVDRLSGGERQRVGLARALVSSASLWLVDEPLSSLDPSRAAQAIDTLTRSASEHGATLITSLHQVDVAKRFQRIIGLRDGTMQFDLPSAEVTSDRLAALYAQHEEELLGAPMTGEEKTADNPLTTPLYCR